MLNHKDKILEGVISFITSICDQYDETKGLMTIRRYQDGPRPTDSLTGSSCGNYALSTFAEISLDSMGRRKVCKVYQTNENNCSEEVSIKYYRPVVQVTIIGCNAFDVAKTISDALELFELRYPLIKSGLSYLNHSDLIDLTALEETLHNERYQFDITFDYCCETRALMPELKIESCLRGLRNYYG